MKDVADGSCKPHRSDNSCGSFSSEERDTPRIGAGPRLLCLRPHSRRDRIRLYLRTVGDATDISKDTWRQSDRLLPHSHLLSEVFHEGHGYSQAVLEKDRNPTMILLAGFLRIASSLPARTDASLGAPDRERDRAPSQRLRPGNPASIVMECDPGPLAKAEKTQGTSSIAQIERVLSS